MALTESIEYDKIEVVGQYKNVQVRKATVIKKDDIEISRSFERFVLIPGTLDGEAEKSAFNEGTEARQESKPDERSEIKNIDVYECFNPNDPANW